MNSISGIPNVFGQTKNFNSSKPKAKQISVAVNGGLDFKSDNLLIKLDPNPSNDLSLSNLGLIGNALKLSGGSLTGDIVMNGNKITGLDINYPPNITTQATSWSQVKKLVDDYSRLSWTINGNNAAGQNIKFGTLDNFDLEFIRNGQFYLIFNGSEILLNKTLNMNNFSLCKLLDPINAQDASTKCYVDRKFQTRKFHLY